MRLFRLIHIVTVYFWDYSGPLLLPFAIMVGIILLLKWYDRKFLACKNDKFAPCSEVSEEMVKFINVQQFMDQRQDAKSCNVDECEPSSFTVSATVGTMDRNESCDFSQDALRKEAIAALNCPSENDEFEVSSFASETCNGDKQTCIPEATNYNGEETHVNKIQLDNGKPDQNNITASPFYENGGDGFIGLHSPKLNFSRNLEHERELDKDLSNCLKLCTETSVLSLREPSAVDQYLPPIIITGKSTDLDSLEDDANLSTANSAATSSASSELSFGI